MYLCRHDPTKRKYEGVTTYSWDFSSKPYKNFVDLFVFSSSLSNCVNVYFRNFCVTLKCKCTSRTCRVEAVLNKLLTRERVERLVANMLVFQLEVSPLGFVSLSARRVLETRGNAAAASSLGYSLASFCRCHSQSPLHLSTSVVSERDGDGDPSEYLNKYSLLYSRARGSLVE